MLKIQHQILNPSKNRLRTKMAIDLANNNGLLLERYTFSLFIFLLLSLYIIYYRMFLLDNTELDWPKKMVNYGRLDFLIIFLIFLSQRVILPTPLILTWTNFFGQPLMKAMLDRSDVSQCPYLCKYSSDRSLWVERIIL